ncbi:RHS repeat domain-containing protein [Candidatus Sodalis pierantonius]|uniref:RHS repeat domain-containing protein n=1 Tax=Candidatus Sodalis pierantonii TaxID=1486991 RepID=UPI00046CB12A|nr:RHS repeat-associated core domain-containing protein [Candidatus Sodalis pierantonius]
MEVHFVYDHLDRMTRRQVRLPGQENVTTRWLFDAFNRPVNILVTSQTGAETPVELIISQQFNGLDQIVKRTLQERRGGKSLRRYESFDYSARGCLTACRYAGELSLLAVVGEQFEQVIAETFTWDALNNLTEATIHYAQPTQTGCPAEQTARYGYHHPDCPSRRTSIQYGGADARTVQLVYDPQGRLTDDGHRRRYRYDPLGRLQAVSGDGLPETFYCYDAFNRLQGQSGEDATSLHFYHGRRLTHIKHHCPTRPAQEIDRVSYVHAAGLAAVKTLSALGTDILLTATDSRGRIRRYGRKPTLHYLAWGTPAAATSSFDAACASPLPRYLPLWQGELYDTASGGYFLGSGYRLYRPDLQGFTTQDNLRVGGLTGINRYLYGRGDPINRYDPDGRLSWNAWVNYAYGAGATLMAPVVFLAAGPAGLATALTLSATQLTSSILAIAAGMLIDSIRTWPACCHCVHWVSRWPPAVLARRSRPEKPWR